MTLPQQSERPDKCWNCYGFGYVMVSTGNTVTPHEKFPCPYCRPHQETRLAQPAPPQGALVDWTKT